MATGRFIFTSSEVPVPEAPLNGVAAFRRPFTFLGLVNFKGSSVEHRLTGDGIATIRFYEPDAGTIHPLQIDYDFIDQQPVPEPGTLLLIGSGLAVAALARRRKQRRSSPAPSFSSATDG